MTSNEVVQKLWNLCNVLRDDGITYHEYVTELTYILFLKMSSELENEEKIGIPLKYRWKELAKLEGIELKNNYQKCLLDLGQIDGKLGIIYRNAQTKIEEPANLKKIFNEINKIDWYSVDKEDLGDLYEGLLEKNASEKKSGAGQYFTPRVLIDSIVRIIKPELGERICDPAAGTFGFIIEADKYLRRKYDDYFGTKERPVTDEEREFQATEAFSACELVPDTHRLGIMNALLHGINGNFVQGDSLSETGKQLRNFDLILSNPPFGTKKGGERVTRDDLVYETSNKQLNFLQIIYRSLKTTGKARAAVIIPDNVLFEGGVGKDIRMDLLNKCNLHTVLRLPTGIFYAQGVKANVLFFTKGGSTKDIWFYDYRTDVKHTLATNPMQRHHLDDFVSCYHAEDINARVETYNAEANPNGRWRKYTCDEIITRDKTSLDVSWIKQGGDEVDYSLSELIDIIKEKSDNISKAVAELQKLMANIED